MTAYEMMRISRQQALCYTQLNDELVILNPENEDFFHLNASATDLWLALDSPKTMTELAQVLAGKYLGLAEDYQQDVIDWIEHTTAKGLLTRL